MKKPPRNIIMELSKANAKKKTLKEVKKVNPICTEEQKLGNSALVTENRANDKTTYKSILSKNIF